MITEWCSIEQWVTLGCLYLGAVFYSLLISSIASILQSANLASQEFEEILLQADDYMRTKKIPSSTRERVKENLHLQQPEGKMFNEQRLFNMLTPVLQRELQLYNTHEILKKVPFFKNDRSFAEDICMALTPTFALEREAIFKANTTGRDMYFIANGIVDLYFEQENQHGGEAETEVAYMSIGDGCFFGEVSLLLKKTLTSKRTTHARANTKCVLYKLSREKLHEVLEDHDEIRDQLMDIAYSRYNRVENFKRPMSVPLMLGNETDSEDERTALFKRENSDEDDGEYADAGQQDDNHKSDESAPLSIHNTGADAAAESPNQYLARVL
jgi:CRP-like cAMP-binding protein